MNVLVIAPYIPSRIRVRPFHLIGELAKRHEVHVIALRDADESRMPGLDEIAGAVRELRIVPHSKLRGALQSLAALGTPSPMCTAYCRSRRMKEVVQEVVSAHRFDVVHVEHLRAAHLAPWKSGLPIVFDSVDCLSRLFAQMARSRGALGSRLVAAEEAWKLRRCEPRTLRRFDRVLVTSDSDREALIRLDPALEIDVVPNGVDIDYFAPQGAERKPARLVFSGKMSYAPNAEAVLWFAENVLPSLARRFSGVEFAIVGSNPPPSVAALERIPGVSVTGYVEDMRPYLDSAAIAVAPMRTAVGMQNKILEAMAMALPVVATSAAAGTFGRDCPGILEANSDEEIVRIISRLIESPDEASEIGRQGRSEVAGRFSWARSAELIESAYEKALRDRGGGS